MVPTFCTHAGHKRPFKPLNPTPNPHPPTLSNLLFSFLPSGGWIAPKLETSRPFLKLTVYWSLIILSGKYQAGNQKKKKRKENNSFKICTNTEVNLQVFNHNQQYSKTDKREKRKMVCSIKDQNAFLSYTRSTWCSHVNRRKDTKCS